LNSESSSWHRQAAAAPAVEATAAAVTTVVLNDISKCFHPKHLAMYHVKLEQSKGFYKCIMSLIRTIVQTTAPPCSGWTADGIQINLFPVPRCITRHAFVVWTPPPMQAFGCARSCLCPTEISVWCWYLGDQRFDNSLAEIYSCNVELNVISGPPPSVATVRTSDQLRRAVTRIHSNTLCSLSATSTKHNYCHRLGRRLSHIPTHAEW
jgi:hypothetical protein